MKKTNRVRLVKGLSQHERDELLKDFDIEVYDKHILIALTKEEYKVLCAEGYIV